MHIQFLGGTQTVTGSKYLLTTPKARVRVDCGLYQGYKWLRERNWEELPFDVRSLDAVILTHAHLDHSGYIPVLYKLGYRGPVYCHFATQALCEVLLKDSGHLQEEDARYYQRHKLGKHAQPEPLYDMETAVESCKLLRPVGFAQPFHIKDVKVTLQSAGHILGAASLIIESDGRRVGFSGDVGRPDDLLMYPPEPLPDLDLLLLESTYGNRRHPQSDVWSDMAGIVNDTVKAGGVLVIPSFAVGRTQAIQYLLTRLMDEGRIPRIPVYLDSPMAIDASEIFCHFHSLHRLQPNECREFSHNITYTRSVEDSKGLEGLHFPHIIIAGSGMVTGGRVLHHLKRLLPDRRNTVLFTGYQAGGTRGANMLSGTEAVKIHGEYIPCHARMAILEGLSGHGDYQELTDWLKRSALKTGTPVYLVHGEPDAADAFRQHLQQETPLVIKVAEYLKTIKV